MSFSGNWNGPKLFEQFVMITGKSYRSRQARGKWSAAALLAAYGERGEYELVSLKSPVGPREPKTSSVETCKNLKCSLTAPLELVQYLRAISSRVYVPMILV